MKKILRFLITALFAGAVAAMAQQNPSASSKQAASTSEGKAESGGTGPAVETPQKDSAAAHKSTSAPIVTEVKSENGVVKVIVNVNDTKADNYNDNDTNYFSIDLGSRRSSSEQSGLFHRLKFGGGEKTLNLAGANERPWKFVLGLSYGTGFAASLGAQIESHRGTANFLTNDRIDGGGLGYDYCVWSLSSWLNIWPGVVAGYWNETWKTQKRVYYTTTQYYNDYINHDESYFAGPRVSIEIGLGNYFITASGTLLIGSSVTFPMSAGIVMLF